jgi:hypothetical protein
MSEGVFPLADTRLGLGATHQGYKTRPTSCARDRPCLEGLLGEPPPLARSGRPSIIISELEDIGRLTDVFISKSQVLMAVREANRSLPGDPLAQDWLQVRQPQP